MGLKLTSKDSKGSVSKSALVPRSIAESNFCFSGPFSKARCEITLLLFLITSSFLPLNTLYSCS